MCRVHSLGTAWDRRTDFARLVQRLPAATRIPLTIDVASTLRSLGLMAVATMCAATASGQTTPTATHPPSSSQSSITVEVPFTEAAHAAHAFVFADSEKRLAVARASAQAIREQLATTKPFTEGR